MSHVFNQTTRRIAKSSIQFSRQTTKSLSYDINNVFVLKKIHTTTDFRHFTHTKRIHTKHFIATSKTFSTLSDDHFIEDNAFIDVFDNTFDKKEKNDLRALLYKDVNDNIMMQLNQCQSIQSVFDLVRKEKLNMKSHHLCQTILVLSDLQRSFDQFYVRELENSEVETSPQDMMFNYMSELKNHKDFISLLDLIENNYSVLSLDELSCAIFYLKRMGINNTDNVLNSMIELFHEKVKSNEFPSIQSLVRYTSVFEARDSLRFVPIAAKMLPLLLTSLDSCDSAEDFHGLTLCLNNIHSIISIPVLELYKIKTKELVDSGIINTNTEASILKALSFLNLPHWSKYNFEIVNLLCQLLKNSIKNLDVSDIISLHKVFQSYLSPMHVMVSVKDRASELLEKSKNDDRMSTFLKIPDLLFCQVMGAAANNRQRFEEISNKFMKFSFPTAHVPLYKILRYIKSPDLSVCDKFWLQTSFLVKKFPLDDYRLLRISQKYMYFYSNVHELYRCAPFEKEIFTKFMNVENSLAIMLPSKLSRITAFCLAYGLCNPNFANHDMLNLLITKLEEMSTQLDHLSCLILSKGLYISSLITKHRYTTTKEARFVMRIDTILDNCASIHIKLPHYSTLSDLNIICKTFLNRGARFDTDRFNDLLIKYSQVDENFASRTIRDAAYNLICCSVVVPPLFDRLIDYIVNQGDDLLGDSAQKILQLCYITAYQPKNERYFQVSIDLILRDKELLSGLTLLQACLELCYFGCLPDLLVKYIFSIEFMERLDEEMSQCYSKLSYPSRIRKQLMHLNRSVCLELPQHEIPWFHEKYIQQRNISKPSHMSIFQKDVLDVLSKAVGSSKAVKSKYFTPYGYMADFLIALNKNKIVLPTPSAMQDGSITKIAILLLDQRNFVKMYNSPTDAEDLVKVQWSKTGPTISRSRHLELMGYRVLEISETLWNSMHMAEPHEKITFLQNQILN